MKFEEKITKLRKKAGLSQEELAEKLNVTRQTISKWELGQSKPDFDKLIEISKIFNIGLEELTNGNENVEKTLDENIQADFNVKPRKWILVILIILALVIVVVLADKFIKNLNSKKSENDNSKGISSIFDKTFEIFNNVSSEISSQNYDFNKSSFNSDYELYIGTKWGSSCEPILNNAITNNKKNTEHLIIVKYNGKETSDPTEITDIKQSLDKWEEYEISLNYDENGFVSEIIIEAVESSKTNEQNSEFEKTSFNSKYEIHTGTKFGLACETILNNAVTNNKTNEKHKLLVKYKRKKYRYRLMFIYIYTFFNLYSKKLYKLYKLHKCQIYL